MAPLIANGSTYTFRSTRPLDPSPHLQMPHVFVIPPEEEQQENPPWCCFDADEQPGRNGEFPSNSNIHFRDISYTFQSSENDPPARPSVHQPQPRAPVSRKLEKKQRPEALKIIETRTSLTRQKGAREDSDVIEVVKVKRAREALTDLEDNTKAKRSKTLKSRATKALQSIKNVGKGSHRTHVKDLWTSSESMPGIFKGVQEQIRSHQDQKEDRPPATLPKIGSLSRSSSRSLSQIFQPTKPSRPEMFTVHAETPVTEAHAAIPTSNPLSLKFNDTNLSLIEIPDSVMADDMLNEPVSPNLSTKKSITAKFSVRELHRLFSFSLSSSNNLSSASAISAASLTAAAPSTAASIKSPGHLDVPTEEDADADVHHLDLGIGDRNPILQHRQVLRNRPEDVSCLRRLSDFSFEMRLDSLHFDALSFDPEDFDVQMEGNVLR